LGDAPCFPPYLCPRILKVLRNENLFEHRPFFSASVCNTHAQDITQTLRGTIYDQTGQIELSKATLVIPNISYKIEF